MGGYQVQMRNPPGYPAFLEFTPSGTPPNTAVANRTIQRFMLNMNRAAVALSNHAVRHYMGRLPMSSLTQGEGSGGSGDTCVLDEYTGYSCTASGNGNSSSWEQGWPEPEPYADDPGGEAIQIVTITAPRAQTEVPYSALPFTGVEGGVGCFRIGGVYRCTGMPPVVGAPSTDPLINPHAPEEVVITAKRPAAPKLKLPTLCELFGLNCDWPDPLQNRLLQLRDDEFYQDRLRQCAAVWQADDDYCYYQDETHYKNEAFLKQCLLNALTRFKECAEKAERDANVRRK